MTRCLLPLVAAVALLAARPADAQLVVPSEDYPTIQAAIDKASPGDTILVQGGTYDPITIDKALTITGTSTVRADSVVDEQTFQLTPPVTLAGSGGDLVLEGMTVTGSTDGQIFGQNVAGMVGGGFDEVVLRDCAVTAPAWFSLTGLGIGEPAITVGTPLLRLEGTTVTGGFTDVDVCDATNLADGAAGIITNGTVSLVDSTVTGGSGPFICLTFGCAGAPANLCDSFDGSGGPGLICTTAIIDFTTSSVQGGPGRDVPCSESEQIVCTMPDGPDILADSTLSLGGQLVVPGTHDTIPEALDAAAPGDTVLVLGGDHGPFTVTEPVTLLARPQASVDNDGEGFPSIQLLGDGGRATLIGFDVGGSGFSPGPSLRATGFDDVALIDCDVASRFVFAKLGQWDGGSGLLADVGHLLLSDTRVTGGDAASPFVVFVGDEVRPGGPAVELLGATQLTAIDSTLEGGAGGSTTTVVAFDCDSPDGGLGGPGVVGGGARYASNTSFVGGPGAEIFGEVPSVTDGGPVCTFPDGAPFLGEAPLDLGVDLVGSGALAVGGEWTLGWQATAPSVLLIVSPLPSAPIVVPGAGVLYASLEAASITSLPGAGIFFLSGPVPDDPALIGVLATFQLYDPFEGLSRPVIEPFAP